MKFPTQSHAAPEIAYKDQDISLVREAAARPIDPYGLLNWPVQVISRSITSPLILKVNYAHKIVCNCLEIPVKSRIYFTFDAKGEIRNQGRDPAGYHSTLRTSEDPGYHDQGDRSRKQLFRPACSCGSQPVGCQNPGMSIQQYCRATSWDISRRPPFKRGLKDILDLSACMHFQKIQKQDYREVPGIPLELQQ